MKISEWCTKFNMVIHEPETVSNASAWPTGNKFVVEDMFTVRDGHWYYEDGLVGGVPQWAVDKYAQPNQMGAATFCYIRVLKPDDTPSLETQVAYWTDGGYAKLASFDGKSQPSWLTVLGKDKINPGSGWFEFDMNHTGWPYNPDTGAKGPACVIKTPGLSACVEGVGLPYSWHISTFIVFKEVERNVVAPPVVPPDTGNDALTRIAVAFEKFNAFLGVK